MNLETILEAHGNVPERIALAIVPDEAPIAASLALAYVTRRNRYEKYPPKTGLQPGGFGDAGGAYVMAYLLPAMASTGVQLLDWLRHSDLEPILGIAHHILGIRHEVSNHSEKPTRKIESESDLNIMLSGQDVLNTIRKIQTALELGKVSKSKSADLALRVIETLYEDRVKSQEFVESIMQE